jgi:hypothetical protein
VADKDKTALYEGFEPRLNGGRVRLVDVAKVEQELLGLVWRGSRIDHPGGEHDDWANAVAGVVDVLATPAPGPTVAVVMPSGGGQHAEWRRGYFG